MENALFRKYRPFNRIEMIKKLNFTRQKYITKKFTVLKLSLMMSY